MLSLTRKTDYALVALAYLAERQRTQQDLVSARHIAETFNLPQPLLMNILKELCQAEIVSSTRGSQGGYALAVHPDQLTLLRIVEVLEGPVRFAPCCKQTMATQQYATPDECCSREDECPIQHSVHRLHRRLNSLLAETTLLSLLDDAPGTACQCQTAVPLSVGQSQPFTPDPA